MWLPERKTVAAKHEEFEALDALTEDSRTVVMLADVEGYGYSEIAAILNVPIGTVRSRISRGRDRLRAMLS